MQIDWKMKVPWVSQCGISSLGWSGIRSTCAVANFSLMIIDIVQSFIDDVQLLFAEYQDR